MGGLKKLLSMDGKFQKPMTSLTRVLGTGVRETERE